jgi:quercetin dioxygenase-like cupin family protein
MKKLVTLVAIATVLCLAVLSAGQESKRVPRTFSLECGGGDCVLLKGAPVTSGMRGGSVKLKPGESVGWHSTNQSEEALVIQRGSGKASIEGGADVALREGVLAYIPPATRHNVTNTGSELLEYVWIVAPAAK